jgi:hypothetical protein
MNFNIKQCPKCGGLETFWRHGVHFDHERYCGECQESYDPSEEYEKYLAWERERKLLITDKD